MENEVAAEHDVGDVAGAAITRGQLAQLEAMEGNGERALELAREAVRQLEALGYAQAEQACGVLRNVEQFLAKGGRGAGTAPTLIKSLQQEITDWQKLSASERETRLSRLDSNDPPAAVLSWLAHSVVCFGERDLVGCEAAEAQAHAIATDSGHAELLALVEELQDRKSVV